MNIEYHDFGKIYDCFSWYCCEQDKELESGSSNSGLVWLIKSLSSPEGDGQYESGGKSSVKDPKVLSLTWSYTA